jgi:catechol 2,3-dioxygenase-like lactoylglutathione lyase family enzyme
MSVETQDRPLAVHSLNHFALAVPDLQAAQAFYTNFGLKARTEGNVLALEAANGLTVARVVEGPRKRLHHLSFAVDAADLDPFIARLKAQGIEIERPDMRVHDEAIWFRDPDGNLFEVAAAPRSMPATKSYSGPEVRGPGARTAEEMYQTTQAHGVRPLRLGHCLLFSTDVGRSIDFYGRTLGLRLSDRSGDIVGFMHAPHGCDHHILAFAKSHQPAFHHASFEVEDVDRIGLGAENMVRKGYEKGWGFGRHMAGSNFFYYAGDPWGSFAEYFCDMDYIPAGEPWKAQDLPPEHSLHLWGPRVPDYFLHNAEADQD